MSDNNKCENCELTEAHNLELNEQLRLLKIKEEEGRYNLACLASEFQDYRNSSYYVSDPPDSEEMFEDRRSEIEEEMIELIRERKSNSPEYKKCSETLAEMDNNKASIIASGVQGWLKKTVDEFVNKSSLEGAFKLGKVDRVEIRWTLRPADADESWKPQLEVATIGHNAVTNKRMPRREVSNSGGTSEQAADHGKVRAGWREKAEMYKRLSGTDSERIKQIAQSLGTGSGTVYQSIIRAVSEGELTRVA